MIAEVLVWFFVVITPPTEDGQKGDGQTFGYTTRQECLVAQAAAVGQTPKKIISVCSPFPAEGTTPE